MAGNDLSLSYTEEEKEEAKTFQSSRKSAVLDDGLPEDEEEEEGMEGEEMGEEEAARQAYDDILAQKGTGADKGVTLVDFLQVTDRRKE